MPRSSFPCLLAGLLVFCVALGCQQQVTPQAAAAENASSSEAAASSEQTSSDTDSDQLAQAGGSKSKAIAAKQPAAKDTTSKNSGTTPANPKAVNDGLPDNPFPRRIPAPELTGGVAWINTAGPLELRQLRGKFVLLDFWTYCCINCMHILPELKKLEHKYPKELVVIGVHSAKFDTEQDSQNITDAVQRYEIEHPVVNDANHAIWNRYGVNSWPTMLLIDPEGNAVYMKGGETTFEALDTIFQAAIPYYRKKGTLDSTPLRFDLAASKAEPTPLRYPGKVLADEGNNRLFVADSNHNRIVVATLDGKLLDIIGSGAIGKADGAFVAASFNKPQGMVLQGETLYVADTENHLLRKIDLKTKQVKTIAGTGNQSRQNWPGLDKLDERGLANFRIPDRWVGKPLVTALNSPWDLWIHGPHLYIAMAGPHQIWRMPLAENEIGPYAGNGREDIVDGPLLPKQPYDLGFSSFAQPSGLASDGKLLYVADSEGSSIRAVPFDATKQVATVIGTAHLQGARLFTFGDRDGSGEDVLLQHALGVVWHEGLLYVADTYNNKVKVVDVKNRTSRTLAGNGRPGKGDDPATFDEPAGISAARGKLYVADTNNHLIRTIDLKNGNRVATLAIEGLDPPRLEVTDAEPNIADGSKEIAVDSTTLKAVDGAVTINVKIDLPQGWKINALAPMRYTVTALNETGSLNRDALGKIAKVEPPAATVAIRLPAAKPTGDDRVRLTLNYYYCQEGAEGVCKAGTAVWNIPLTLTASASASNVSLTLKVE